MLNVACVKVGSRYGADYVNVLFDMVRRNLPAGFAGRFVCFTDDATGLDPAIRVRPVPSDLAKRGWWAKLWLFSPEAFTPGERVLYFDLDTCITGPLEQVAAFDGQFAILRDAYRPNGLQSSVMAWEAGKVPYFYDEWLKLGKPDIPGGDQAWLEECLMDGGYAILQDLYPGKLRSYKVECRTAVPRGTSVVFFHGNPRPHEITLGWVPEVWKIGGGSGTELVTISNTDEDTLAANALSAIKRDCAWVSQQPRKSQAALIVGGGPSLKDNVWYIRGMQLAGDKVFATNNTYQYLLTHGIKPDAHVMVDAREANVEFVPDDGTTKYYASQCHPSILDKAGPNLVCWHAYQECYRRHIERHPTASCLIGGGSTVGLRAIALAYLLGYRDFRLFGFDSCYADDSHHAYPQALNDGERVLEARVGGRTFKCAPWMVTQAEEFKELAAALVNMDGSVLTVYGDGMLQTITEEMQKTLREIDGLYWPASDSETRASVMWTLGDLHKYVSLCRDRRVAVQAGGNVGVWPKELSRHFGRVYTFEPDPINWECLERNVDETNVFAKRAALGAAPGFVGIEHHPYNCGASQVAPGDDVEVVTVDSLRLDACDLLQLDIEGYELEALKGAEQTIREHSPVIVLELKGHGERYGTTDDEIRSWLGKLGYKATATHHRDVVFTRSH